MVSDEWAGRSASGNRGENWGLNLNEAKTNFSNVIANVENNLVTVTIMRYGHPVAQIVPIERHNRTKPDPLLSQISYTGDLCENESDDWENA